MNQTKTRNRRTRIYRRYARAREFLLLAFKKYNVTCYFCGKPLGEQDLPLKRTDKLTIHHINGDHYDDRTENKAFCHRSCHRSYHMRERRNGQAQKKNLAHDKSEKKRFGKNARKQNEKRIESVCGQNHNPTKTAKSSLKGEKKKGSVRK